MPLCTTTAHLSSHPASLTTLTGGQGSKLLPSSPPATLGVSPGQGSWGQQMAAKTSPCSRVEQAGSLLPSLRRCLGLALRLPVEPPAQAAAELLRTGICPNPLGTTRSQIDVNQNWQHPKVPVGAGQPRQPQAPYESGAL